MQEQTGKVPPGLDIPPVPHELIHVWQYFLDMNRKRQCGMSISPLADSEILAWERRNRITLTPFEGECIDALDEVFLASASEAPSK
ncbi:phage tail assembly chaperone [Janthinobacterium sp. LB2P10]|uniref:phage tail assembly chaperone n=1 Tax=Janthinobacterium sp. LB2P10 TaxID=3424194 RepID=UPI003F250C34